jgi:hypothetical protein
VVEKCYLVRSTFEKMFSDECRADSLQTFSFEGKRKEKKAVVSPPSGGVLPPLSSIEGWPHNTF